jgi:biofilm PGA synthesis N-glycosyltransferase PgaC
MSTTATQRSVVPQPGVADARILIVSPVRNEGPHIERVVRAVAAQTLLPERWVIVDDSSEDETLAILRRLEIDLPFLTVVEASSLPPGDVPDRLARAAAPRAFNAGLAAAGDWREYTHIMKLDGDIELKPTYLRTVVERLAAEPSLGLVGGVLDEPVEGGGLRRIRIPSVHVHGALKCYTRTCFIAIGGVQECLGWDTIDETYARMRGFAPRTYHDLVSLHHRPLGSADGTLRGHARHGECAYIAHFTLSWVALRAVKIATRRPYGASGIAFLYGYIRAALKRVRRVEDPEFRRFTHRELRRRLVHGATQLRVRGAEHVAS